MGRWDRGNTHECELILSYCLFLEVLLKSAWLEVTSVRSFSVQIYAVVWHVHLWNELFSLVRLATVGLSMVK